MSGVWPRNTGVLVMSGLLVLGLVGLAGSPAGAGEPEPGVGAESSEPSGHTRFVVRLRADEQSGMASLAESVDVAVGDPGGATTRRLGEGMASIEVPRDLSPEESQAMVDALQADPQVLWAEPVSFMQTADFPQTPPDDPRWGDEWALWDTYGVGVGSTSSVMEPTWSLSTGEDTVVAVLDTGYSEHEDLPASQLVAGYDFVQDWADYDPRNTAFPPSPDAVSVDFDGDYVSTGSFGDLGWDDNPLDPGDWGGIHSVSTWHGTRVAGIVGAATDNGVGMAGLAPQVRIQPVRVVSWAGGASDDLAAAITWASGGDVTGVPGNATPAQVINLSLASTLAEPCPSAVATAVLGAMARGTLVVSAAGNSQDVAADYWPGNCEGVMNVGATTLAGKRGSYSNYGSDVDLSAPGDAILSLTNPGLYTPEGTTGTYDTDSGTSFASPLVAGTAALLLGYDSSLTPNETANLLMDTATAFPDGACDSDPGKTCGAGIVSASSTLQAQAEADSRLSALALSAGTLTPAFAPGVTSYSAAVPNGTASVLVTPTAKYPGASITVRGTPVTSGDATSVPLAVGANSIPVVVDSVDSTSTTTYQLSITRADSGGGGGGSTEPGETPAPSAPATLPPRISAVDPTSGPTGGGTLVSIVGENLQGATGATIGGAAAVILDNSNPLSLLVGTPPGRPGTYDVVVTTSGGQSVLSGAYTYLAPEEPQGVVVIASKGGVERVIVPPGAPVASPKVVFRGPAGRRIATSPMISTKVGVATAPRVRRLPKSREWSVFLLTPGPKSSTRRLFMGRVTTSRTGAVTLPAMRATRPVDATYRIKARPSKEGFQGSYYVRVNVTRGGGAPGGGG